MQLARQEPKPARFDFAFGSASAFASASSKHTTRAPAKVIARGQYPDRVSIGTAAQCTMWQLRPSGSHSVVASVAPQRCCSLAPPRHVALGISLLLGGPPKRHANVGSRAEHVCVSRLFLHTGLLVDQVSLPYARLPHWKPSWTARRGQTPSFLLSDTEEIFSHHFRPSRGGWVFKNRVYTEIYSARGPREKIEQKN